MNPGDQVWAKALVTSVKDDRIGIGVRIAARKGSSYAGSSPKNARVIDGVVYRTVEVPLEDVALVEGQIGTIEAV
jgi:hypothetical protein